jgi:hypothetical protein
MTQMRLDCDRGSVFARQKVVASSEIHRMFVAFSHTTSPARELRVRMAPCRGEVGQLELRLSKAWETWCPVSLPVAPPGLREIRISHHPALPTSSFPHLSGTQTDKSDLGQPVQMPACQHGNFLGHQ